MIDTKRYKGTLRIPCKEQYAYMEIEMVGTKDEIIEDYLEFTSRYQELKEEKEKNIPPF